MGNVLGVNEVVVDKIGSATSPVDPAKTVRVSTERRIAAGGDVVAARALSETAAYGNFEVPSSRLAGINTGDVLPGMLGERRALKGWL